MQFCEQLPCWLIQSLWALIPLARTCLHLRHVGWVWGAASIRRYGHAVLRTFALLAGSISVGADSPCQDLSALKACRLGLGGSRCHKMCLWYIALLAGSIIVGADSPCQVLSALKACRLGLGGSQYHKICSCSLRTFALLAGLIIVGAGSARQDLSALKACRLGLGGSLSALFYEVPRMIKLLPKHVRQPVEYIVRAVVKFVDTNTSIWRMRGRPISSGGDRACKGRLPGETILIRSQAAAAQAGALALTNVLNNQL